LREGIRTSDRVRLPSARKTCSSASVGAERLGAPVEMIVTPGMSQSDAGTSRGMRVFAKPYRAIEVAEKLRESAR